MKAVRLEVNSVYNREKIISALADEGYWVRVEVTERDVGSSRYYVMVEVPNHAVLAPNQIEEKAS